MSTLDELANQLKHVFANTAAEDLQKNLRATLSAGLARLDAVTQQEFEVQREMLAALREQVAALTAKIEALEQQRDGKPR